MGVGTNNEPSRKTRTQLIAELGPAWITAIAVLIGAMTAVAGFFLGHATVSNASPHPTVTVTVTRPASATSVSSNGPSSPTPSTESSNGVLLGSYSIDLNYPNSVPLGPSKPTQSQFNTGGAGDLGTGAPADTLVFVPLNGDKMVSLPNGATPTYQACATSSVFASQASSTAGTAFCLIESGRIAGLMVTSDNSSYAALQVSVWQNIS